VRLLEEYTAIELSPSSRAEILRYADSASVWERNDALVLLLLAPEMHVA
jgi:GH43 family beta-xylosidase